MTQKEIASIWLVGLGAIGIIVWQHRASTTSILAALGSPAAGAPPDNVLVPGLPSDSTTTNRAAPMAGNEFGPLATYGNALSGDVSVGGLDRVFNEPFDYLSGQ